MKLKNVLGSLKTASDNRKEGAAKAAKMRRKRQQKLRLGSVAYTGIRMSSIKS
jgi:hypothetical protein